MSNRRVVVAVPTLGRRSLDRLVPALVADARRLEDGQVVLVHNGPSSDASIRQLCAAHGVGYLRVAAAGYATARNTALDEAARRDADWLLFIDDDEAPDPGWLDAHLDAAFRWDADVVLGPVTVEVPLDAPRWLDGGSVLRPEADRPEGFFDGPVYSGNTALRMSFVRQHNLRFDQTYDQLGGEDTEFFARCRQHGANVVWAPAASVREHPDSDRLNLRYVLTRSATSAMTDIRQRRARGVLSLPRVVMRKTAQLAIGTTTVLWGILTLDSRRIVRGLKHQCSAAGTFVGVLKPRTYR